MSKPYFKEEQKTAALVAIDILINVLALYLFKGDVLIKVEVTRPTMFQPTSGIGENLSCQEWLSSQSLRYQEP